MCDVTHSYVGHDSFSFGLNEALCELEISLSHVTHADGSCHTYA